MGRRTALACLAILVALAPLAWVTPPAQATAARPTVRSSSPLGIAAAGGARITVRGTGFKHVRRVLIGGEPARAIKVLSRTKLKVTAPAHAPGLVHVRVVTAAGKSRATRADRIRYLPKTAHPGTNPPPANSQPPADPPPADPDVQAPTAPAVIDDESHATFASTDADASTGPSSGIAGFRYSTTSAATVTGGGGAFVAATGAQAEVALPPATGAQHLYVVAVDEAGNRSAVTDHLYALAVRGWSPPVRVDATSYPSTTPAQPPVTYLIGCLSAGHCLALTRSGEALTFDGSAWSEPVVVSSAEFLALSCGGPSFCVALDGNGEVWTFDGATWSGPTPVTPPDLGTAALSCSSATSCVLVTRKPNVSYTYDGHSWSGGTPIPNLSEGLRAPVGLSCTSTAFCLLALANDSSYTWDGHTWSDRADVPAGSSGCMTDGHCVDVDEQGGTWVFAAGTWTQDKIGFPWGSQPESLQCSTASCVATFRSVNDLQRFDGTAWTATQTVPYSKPLGVRCATDGSCLLFNAGAAPDITLTTNGTTTVGTYPLRGAPESISCTSDSQCQLVDQTGNAFGGGADSWTRSDFSLEAGWDDVSLQTDLSCTSAAFCMAVGSSTDLASQDRRLAVSTYHGTTWTAPDVVDPSTPNSSSVVACTSSTFCLAADEKAQVRSWNGVSWSAPTQVIPEVSSFYGPDVAAVSCASRSFCVAVGGTGETSAPQYLDQVAVYQNGAWKKPVSVDPDALLVDVSCPTTTFCAARDEKGRVLTYDGSSWSGPETLSPDSAVPDYTPPQYAVSCSSPTLCVATDYAFAYTWDGHAWSTGKVVDAGATGTQRYGLVDVSCGTPTTCSVIDDGGEVIQYSLTSG